MINDEEFQPLVPTEYLYGDYFKMWDILNFKIDFVIFNDSCEFLFIFGFHFELFRPSVKFSLFYF